ncbi:MAG TPA: peroxiredoxin [Candidatus Desulfobacillus sp.]|nr:peroxiredoxin [Candidatus Desulfobacillus sp.]
MPAAMQIDQPVPDFSLPATGGRAFSLSQSLGQTLVLYFYPRDNTAGCSTEAAEFRDLHPAFRRAGAHVFGISRDDIASHEKFKARLRLPFDLLADSEEAACALFGVIRDKKLYGRPVRGIERSTFVIDAGGLLRREWRGVRAAGHAAEVLESIRSMKKAR